jgi:hypothetical protein
MSSGISRPSADNLAALHRGHFDLVNANFAQMVIHFHPQAIETAL